MADRNLGRLIVAVFPAIVAVAVLGCSPNQSTAPAPATQAKRTKLPDWSNFQFRNRSGGEQVYVRSIGPLKYEPPVGRMNGDAGMPGQEFPRHLMVSWRKMEAGEAEPRTATDGWMTTSVPIENYETFQPHENLIVVYLGKGKWRAKFHDSDDSP